MREDYTSTVSSTLTPDPLLECIQERIRNLREELTHIQQLELSLCQGKSLDEHQQTLLSSKPTILHVLYSLELLLKLSKESSSMNDSESKERRDNERYLCISDGYVIFCLDLKDDDGTCKSCSDDRQPLPKISLSMFAKIDLPDDADTYPVIMDPATNLSCFLYAAGDSFRGSSTFKTYHLSLVEDSLSFFDCDTEDTIINAPPKTVGGRILAIESCPPARHMRVLSLRPMCVPCNHIVVADRIYAKVSEEYFAVYDSTSYEWELHKYTDDWDDIVFIHHVAEILKCGFGKCIGKFQHSESSNPLYVVIAIGGPIGPECAAAAYLVTPTGQVLCYQRLPLLFAHFMHRFFGSKGTVIRVDEEGNTLCAIVSGETWFLRQHFLFISTFTVKECPYAGSLLPDLWALKQQGQDGVPVDKYFVKVDVKDWRAYKLGKGDMSEFPRRVTACFLSNSQQNCTPPQQSSSAEWPFLFSQATAVRSHIRKHLRHLKWELKSIRSLELDGQSLSKDQLDRKSVICTLIQEYNNLVGLNRQTNPPITTAPHHHAAVCSESVINRLERGRYLCVSYGFTIFCLDLKQIPLHAISTMNLLEEEIPVSMGFFKVNSDTYMVGGQEFHGFNNNPPSPWDLRLFDHLYRRYGVQGSSRDTYHCSLAAEDNNNKTTSLSLHDCNLIGPLNKPKIWPIVEKIGDKIHVIESLPHTFMNHVPDERLPSHEVLDLKHLDRGWMELPPVSDGADGMFIWNHIVVGHRIFATPVSGPFSFAVFDSTTNKWEWEWMDSKARSSSRYDYAPRPSSINHVSQILRFGWGRSVTRCLDVVEEELYVLIALCYDDDMKMMAEAYLVTPRGRILCFQRIPHFFQDFNRPFQASEGRVIHVDDSDNNVETMCAILHGITQDTWDDFLYISTFTVEQVADADADALVRDLLSSTSYEGDGVISKLPSAVDKVFVNVVVKDVHVYNKDVGPESIGYDRPIGVTACFL